MCYNPINIICVLHVNRIIYTSFYSNLSKDGKLILPFTHLATTTSNVRLHKRLLLAYTTFNITELPHDRENKNA